MNAKLIFWVMLLGINGLHAQTTQTKLDQVELMKQLLGTWKTVFANGNTMILDFTPFGTALEGNVKSITKDTTIHVIKEFWGYDKVNDKIIVAELFNYTPVMEIDIVWFTSSNTIVGVMQKDIASPENADIKYKIEIKSPDTFLMITIKNDNEPSVITWNREKK